MAAPTFLVYHILKPVSSPILISDENNFSNVNTSVTKFSKKYKVKRKYEKQIKKRSVATNFYLFFVRKIKT